MLFSPLLAVLFASSTITFALHIPDIASAVGSQNADKTSKDPKVQPGNEPAGRREYCVWSSDGGCWPNDWIDWIGEITRYRDDGGATVLADTPPGEPNLCDAVYHLESENLEPYMRRSQLSGAGEPAYDFEVEENSHGSGSFFGNLWNKISGFFGGNSDKNSDDEIPVSEFPPDPSSASALTPDDNGPAIRKSLKRRSRPVKDDFRGGIHMSGLELPSSSTLHDDTDSLSPDVIYTPVPRPTQLCDMAECLPPDIIYTPVPRPPQLCDMAECLPPDIIYTPVPRPTHFCDKAICLPSEFIDISLPTPTEILR